LCFQVSLADKSAAKTNSCGFLFGCFQKSLCHFSKNICIPQAIIINNNNKSTAAVHSPLKK